MQGNRLVLVTGGARSGKSSWAESLARRHGGRVAYVATARVTDAEMAARIAAHRRRRPAGWLTVEEPLEVAARLVPLGREAEVILVDCLTVLASNWLLEGPPGGVTPEAAVDNLVCAARQAPAQVILVSNEVGWGVVPASELGRCFRDLAGSLNQAVAAAADEVYLLVSGLPLLLKGPGSLISR